MRGNAERRAGGRGADFNRSELLQLRVLRFGLFQDGDVWVRILPKREEILVLDPAFRRLALTFRSLSSFAGSDQFQQLGEF